MHVRTREGGGRACCESMENADAILKICDEIDRLESEADRVMRSAMAKLFREETDVQAGDQAEGDLRAARVDHRQVRGRRQRHRRHRPRERLSAGARSLA